MPDKAKRIFAFSAGLAVWMGLTLLTGTACFFQAAIGLPCPGCGTMRAFCALAGGDVRGALRWHPLVFFSMILPPAAAGYLFLQNRFGARRFFGHRAANVLFGCLFALYMGVFAVRMLLYFPHTQPLAPYGDALWRMALRLAFQ
jgi:ABC-type molybdate transport system permease subunit